MNSVYVLVLGVIFLSGLFDTFTQVCFKKASDGVDIEVGNLRSALRFGWAFLQRPPAWLAFGSSVCSLMLFLFALTRSDLSFAFSVDSVHHVFIALASWLYLRERLSWKRWLGTALIVLGISLVASGGF